MSIKGLLRVRDACDFSQAVLVFVQRTILPQGNEGPVVKVDHGSVVIVAVGLPSVVQQHVLPVCRWEEIKPTQRLPGVWYLFIIAEGTKED